MTSARIQRQGYRIGGMTLATGFDGARELADMPFVARVPGVPHWVRGIANHHGHPLPVFDIAALLGIAHDASRPEMLLVVGEGEHLAGLVIDGPTERLAFEPSAAVADPDVPWTLVGHVTGAWRDRAAADGAPVWLEFDALAYLKQLADVIGIRETWTL
jgi:chemotaxis signal transduction protein